MCFDLSSNCIGVVTAEVDNGKVIKILSCPIVPPVFKAGSLGFMDSKKKLPTKTGVLNTYYKSGETTITKDEKIRRDALVRSSKDMFVLASIGKSISNLIDNIKPDLIIVEKNAIFNGILTSILLAKTMGVLLGVAGRAGIEVKEYSVNKVRSILNVGKIVTDFSKTVTDDVLKRIPDVTKRAIGEVMSKKYGLKFKTDDESDACVLLHYYLKENYGGQNE
jgi:hypothetical protein